MNSICPMNFFSYNRYNDMETRLYHEAVNLQTSEMKRFQMELVDRELCY